MRFSRLVILLMVDQHARRAAMQMLLDIDNLACCLQGSVFLKPSGRSHASLTAKRTPGTAMTCIALGTS